MASLDRIYCIRFVKLPPATIHLGHPFEIAVAITDDVGTPLADFGKITARLRCLEDGNGSPKLSEVLRVVHEGTREARIEMDSHRGPFFPHKVILVPLSRTPKAFQKPISIKISLALDGASPNSCEGDTLTTSGRRLLKLIGVNHYVRLKSYDENVLLLPTCTGPVSVAIATRTLLAKAGKVARTELHLQPSSGSECLTIVEDPSLHSIGDHLWTSSLVLSSWMESSAEALAAIRSRAVVELGTGCGLVSLAVANLQQGDGRVIATDLQEVIDATLAATLKHNSPLGHKIDSFVLPWGVPRATWPPALAEIKGPLGIVASDVLYNPESHQSFLDSLLDLISMSADPVPVFLTYKHRTQGDDAFFTIAGNAGLFFKMVHQEADVQIWSCESKKTPP